MTLSKGGVGFVFILAAALEQEDLVIWQAFGKC